MSYASNPPSNANNSEEAKINEEELALIAAGEFIPDEQFAIWSAMLQDPKTPDDVRKRIIERVMHRTVDGKLYDGSTPT
ncbi:MAG: hypothetical protein EOO81_08810 [Oxalobacteraceae bacterium]|jgi:hypothetical protein|nr:MAG: hypothetical protein EOO81_08810 [Oxalobacteraceae bacterium]